MRKEFVPDGLFEPSASGYFQIMQDFQQEAQANPHKNYLFIQTFSSSGYCYGGMQAVETPYYDAVKN